MQGEMLAWFPIRCLIQTPTHTYQFSFPRQTGQIFPRQSCRSDIDRTDNGIFTCQFNDLLFFGGMHS